MRYFILFKCIWAVDVLRKLTKILGNLFGVATIAIIIYLLIYKPLDAQVKNSWLMVTFCGSMIFSVLASYLTNKDKRALRAVVILMIILIVVLVIFPF